MAVCNRVTALRSSRHGAPLKKIQLIRCQWSTPSNCLQRPSLFSLPLLARSFSSAPRRQGFWDSVWNIITFKQDFVYAKLHKAISEMLEDYDAALLNSFLAALHAADKAYYSGSKEDLHKSFELTGDLKRLITRMENYINESRFLRRTVLPELFHQGELQQKADIFLEKMEAKYGKDEDYQTIMAERLAYVGWIEGPQPDKETKPLVPWMFNLVHHGLELTRSLELQTLEDEYKQTQEYYDAAKASGRRKDVQKAIAQSYRLESILKYRYDGILWEEDMAAGKIDPRLKRSKEEMEKLERLQNGLREMIAKVRRDLGDVLDDGTGRDKK